MEDYVCITVLSRPGEAQADFAARLSQLWTRMLRQRKDDFARVYAETTSFEDCADIGFVGNGGKVAMSGWSLNENEEVRAAGRRPATR